MMRAFLTFLALILSTATLAAQAIPVRSGDHAEFTRLVLNIGTDREWELSQTAGAEWSLALSPPGEGFDTSTSFDLIQRNRLAGLSATETLALTLACACNVTSFRHNDRYLVIDISDPDPNAEPPEAVHAQQPAEPSAEERAAAAAAIPNLTNLLLSPGALPDVPTSDPPLDTAPEVSPEAGETPNPRLAEAAEIMAEQLARAAASGLLDAALDQPMNLGDPAEVHALPAAPELHEEPGAESLVNPADPHPPSTEIPAGPLPIRAETAFDPAIPLEFPLNPAPVENSCDNVPFDVSEWATGHGLSQGLGDLRRGLYDERDILTTEGAIDLARHYLFYGFGAEATYWLTQLTDPPQDLLHIAALVDGAPSAPFPNVITVEDCSPGELLWRYAAGSVTTRLQEPETSALQRAFGELPPFLRDNLGPRLARELAQDGHARTARNIRDILRRGGRMEAAALRLLDLDLGISPDATVDQTQVALAEALRDDGSDPVAIMAHALAFDRSIGALPTLARLTAADALIREIGDGPETDDLWRETLLGYAALGQIDEAVTRLGDPVRGDAARARALTDLIAERVAVGDTAALVVLAYTYGADWRPEGSTAGRIQVRAIATLREAGLFEAAQILRDVRRPLILPAPEAPPQEPEDPARIAWAEQDWTRLAETGNGTHADIAGRLARLEGEGAGNPVSSLTSLAAAVNDSRTLRTEIADLLAQPTPP